MNKFLAIGRLTADPQLKYTKNGNAVGRYTLAVNKTFQKNGDAKADFIPCVLFGKSAEFAEKYLKKGTKVVVEGSVTTNTYTNKDGKTVFTVEVLVVNQEFAESKASAQSYQQSQGYAPVHTQNTAQPTNQYHGNAYAQAQPTTQQNAMDDSLDGFMQMPEGIDQYELPFA